MFFTTPKYATSDISLATLDLDDIVQFFEEEGVQKVRFCLEPDGKIFIVPIFCPRILVPKSGCQDISWKGIKLCQILPSEVPRSSILCRDCLNLNLQVRALRSIIKVLAEKLIGSGCAIRITELSWPELEYTYQGIRSVLRDLLDRMLLR